MTSQRDLRSQISYREHATSLGFPYSSVCTSFKDNDGLRKVVSCIYSCLVLNSDRVSLYERHSCLLSSWLCNEEKLSISIFNIHDTASILHQVVIASPQ